MFLFLFAWLLLFPSHQEGKDKSFLLERLQDLQKSIPNKNTKQKKQKGVCC